MPRGKAVWLRRKFMAFGLISRSTWVTLPCWHTVGQGLLDLHLLSCDRAPQSCWKGKGQGTHLVNYKRVRKGVWLLSVLSLDRPYMAHSGHMRDICWLRSSQLRSRRRGGGWRCLCSLCAHATKWGVKLASELRGGRQFPLLLRSSCKNSHFPMLLLGHLYIGSTAHFGEAVSTYASKLIVC